MVNVGYYGKIPDIFNFHGALQGSS
jgi:hypothetical protein